MFRRARRASCAALTATLLVAAPAAKADSLRPGGKDAWSEAGEASYYSSAFRGRRTSSGERYEPSAMTAAHPTLPLGTRIRVTVADTGASAVVRINDRPSARGRRVIDLSRAAAERLGITGRGVAWVTLTRAAPGEEPVEVAEAPDEADASPAPLPPTRRHGPRHRRHAFP